MHKLITILMLVCWQSMGANWYVDNAATGANSGASWSNAWTNFNAVVWGSVAAGDTIYVSGGTTSKTYTNHIEFQASGTAGNPITISPGVDAGHNGQVILDLSVNVAFWVRAQSYITIDGLRGNVLAGQSNYGFKVLGLVAGAGGVYSADNPQGITVRHVQFCGGGGAGGDDQGPVRLTARTVEVGYCWVYGYPTNFWHVSGITVWGGPTHCYSNKVENCYHDGIKSDDQATIEYNEVSGIWGSGHSDSILIQSAGNAIVRGNYIHDSEDQNLLLANELDTTVTNILVYNNVIVNTNGFGILIDPAGGAASFYDGVKILNNTIAASGGDAISLPRRGLGVTNLTIKNNIIGPVTAAGYSASVLVDTNRTWFAEFDFNCYSSTTNAGIVSWGSVNKSLAGMRAMGYEIHGTNGAPPWVSGATRNYALSTPLPGANLSSIFTTDKNGVTRTGTWDMGAYQYPSSGKVTTPGKITFSGKVTL